MDAQTRYWRGIAVALAGDVLVLADAVANLNPAWRPENDVGVQRAHNALDQAEARAEAAQ